MSVADFDHLTIRKIAGFIVYMGWDEGSAINPLPFMRISIESLTVMANAITIESRLESLEREMAQFRRRLNTETSIGNWLEKLVGSQESDPDFQEVLKLGHQARSADRPVDPSGE